MRPDRKNVNRYTVIETAAQLIDNNNGIKDVTLREIAKELGCAHTNLYNYFGSLDEIYWETLGMVLIKMVDYSTGDGSICMDTKEGFFMAMSNCIDFSLDHPGWFRLIWFEAMNTEPSQEVFKKLVSPGQQLAAALIKASKNKLTKERADLVSDIMFRYLHGELCLWINKRSFVKSKEEMKENVMSNLKLLFELLV